MTEYRDDPHVFQRRVAQLQVENEELRAKLERGRVAPRRGPSPGRVLAVGGLFVAGAVGTAIAVSGGAEGTPSAASAALSAESSAPPPAKSEPRPPSSAPRAAPRAPSAQPQGWSFSATLSKHVGGTFDGVVFRDCEVLAQPATDDPTGVQAIAVQCVADQQPIMLFEWRRTSRQASSTADSSAWSTDGAGMHVALTGSFSRWDVDEKAVVKADVAIDTKKGTASIKVDRPSGRTEFEFTNLQLGRRPRPHIVVD